jgi:hypothetical protein
MADTYLYENLPVAIRDRGESYEVGVVIDGGFFAFGGFKAGGFNEDLAEAQEAQAEAKKSKRSSSKSDTAEA